MSNGRRWGGRGTAFAGLTQWDGVEQVDVGLGGVVDDDEVVNRRWRRCFVTGLPSDSFANDCGFDFEPDRVSSAWFYFKGAGMSAVFPGGEGAKFRGEFWTGD